MWELLCGSSLRGRWSEAEHFYFVTAKTNKGEPVFNISAHAGIVMRSIDWMETEGRWTWHCFVVMPNHLHLVFELKEEEPIDGLMKSMKRFTAAQINKTACHRGSVWQDGFFDHRIRSNEKLEQIAFYCFRNPVNAKLVLEGEDWPFFRCKPALWKAMNDRYNELLALEAEEKGWKPPPGAES